MKLTFNPLDIFMLTQLEDVDLTKASPRAGGSADSDNQPTNKNETMKINTAYKQYITDIEDDSCDLQLPDGSVASFHHNEEHMILTLYQERLKDDDWQSVIDGKTYAIDFENEKEYTVTDDMIDTALDWFGFVDPSELKDLRAELDYYHLHEPNESESISRIQNRLDVLYKRVNR